MKIFEKFKEMPVKVKLASIFLVPLSLLILYTLPWLILGIAFGFFGTFFALTTMFEYFGWIK
jgi:hypothetical protein